MPKIDLSAIEQVSRTGYPPPHDAAVAGRWYRRLSPATGLTHFGVSHVTLKPGAWSSQRHWHHGEDEFLVMLDGEATLVEDDGPTPLRPGDCVAWAKGVPNGHHLRNESERDCTFVVVGAGDSLGGVYSDIDMVFTADDRYTRKDGAPYESTPPPLPAAATSRPPTWIAEQPVVFLHADGRRVAGRIALGAPTSNARSSSCALSLEGLDTATATDAKPLQIHGDTTLQALMLAADFATRMLKLFVERGGRVLMEDTDDDHETNIDMPLDAIFGRLWASAPR